MCRLRAVIFILMNFYYRDFHIQMNMSICATCRFCVRDKTQFKLNEATLRSCAV